MDPFSTTSSLGELVKAFGPSALFISYLIWESRACREDRKHFIEFIEGMANRAEGR